MTRRAASFDREKSPGRLRKIHMMRTFAIAVVCVALAACGKVQTLVDATGGSGDTIDANAGACATAACSATADGCCPAACNAATDADCAPTCDNGVIEAGEVCDPLASCPASCAQVGCLLRTLDQPGTCKATCVNGGTQTACIKDTADGCCPGTCNANDDLDCAATCDNGVIEAGEQCDPLASCPTACPQQQCALFQLFDGGTCHAQCVPAGTQTACVDNDGCCPGNCNANNDSDCTPTCGNGAVEAGETCDPPGSCPDCAAVETYTCYGQLGAAASCDVVCHQPITKCGTSGDSCCAFDGTGGGCGAGEDKECQADRWAFARMRDFDFRNGCTFHRLGGFVAGGSYAFTTCVPGGVPNGTGDPVIKSIVDENGVDYAANDDCDDKTALPHAIGWDCRTDVGADKASCATPSPGGFILKTQPAFLDVTVCPGVKAGVTPLYIWYNAKQAPHEG
jgi:hypothetical protein